MKVPGVQSHVMVGLPSFSCVRDSELLDAKDGVTYPMYDVDYCSCHQHQ